MNPNLDGARLLGAKPTASKSDGWRRMLRDERVLLRHIALIQNSMRAGKVIPLWANFWQMRYRRDMEQYFDTRMWRKFKAWWDLIYDIGDIDRAGNKAKLGFAWGFLVCEVMARKHNRPRQWSAARWHLTDSVAASLMDQVLQNYDALTLE